jgi:hypothetical protein
MVDRIAATLLTWSWKTSNSRMSSHASLKVRKLIKSKCNNPRRRSFSKHLRKEPKLRKNNILLLLPLTTCQLTLLVKILIKGIKIKPKVIRNLAAVRKPLIPREKL